MRSQALRVSRILRDANISVETEVLGRRMVKALEDADRRKMHYAVLVGEREMKEKTVVIRDLRRRDQKTVTIDEAIEIINQSRTERS